MRDSIVIRLPLFGTLMIKASVARFASIFSILQAAGWMGSVDIEIGAIPEWQAPREREGLERAFASLSEARRRAAGG